MSAPTPEVDPTPGVGLPAWLPSTATIEALMPVRFPGGLSAESVPTLAQVQTLIELVHDLVVASCDAPTPALEPLARATVAMGVASWVENGSFPEQSEDGRGGPATFYRLRYSEQMDQLRRSIVTARRTLPVLGPDDLAPPVIE